MPSKPEFFEPKNYLPNFYNNILPHLNQKLLTEVCNFIISLIYFLKTYMDCGGRQWRDSVDSELTVNVIKYLMDSPIRGGILVIYIYLHTMKLTAFVHLLGFFARL